MNEIGFSPMTDETAEHKPISNKDIDSPKLAELRAKLGRKAKQEPQFRFYSLYSHVYRIDTLREAYKRVKRNRGTPGIDGVSFEDIERQESGIEGFLADLQASLRNKTYRPDFVKRVYIDKPNGGKRPLSIPVIRDRVAQMACVLILGPIFEEDFEDCSYGYRPYRSAKEAVTEVRKNLNKGFTGVLDADITGFFDNIDHDRLMTLLEQRIADRSILHLIQLWLQCPVIEVDKESGKKTFTYPKKGTPQGGVISPLMANIYLNPMDQQLSGPDGQLKHFGARLVRYADDFVILARYIGPKITGLVSDILTNQLGLSLHPDKTRILDMRQNSVSFDFLGYTFRFDKDLYGRDQKYLNVCPSKKSITRVQNKIKQMTQSSNKLPVVEVVKQINTTLKGWGNYFDLGYPRKAFRDIDRYVLQRLIGFLKRRSQRPTRRRSGESWYRYVRNKGLVPLQALGSVTRL